ncbi:MAG: T9SS type A sorting domain-containing protein [Calditrichaeota bacterium]|nr:T9SS type A sorting domain-containing protein [Calditrichota bacterium]
MSPLMLLFSILVLSQFAFAQGFATKNVVSDTLILAKKFNVVDLDDDGDMDIVSAANDETTSPRGTVVWFENDGTETFTQHTISDSTLGARSIWVADYNEDGDLDVAAGGDGRQPLSWFENDGTPSNGGWTHHSVGTADSVIYTIHAFDIDEDTDLEILASYYNIQNDNGGDKIRWFDNNGSGSFSANTLVSNYEAAASVEATTIDSDSDIDIVTVAAGEANAGNAGKDLSWWSNNGSESFTQNSITPLSNGPWVVSTADVDSDGDNDILLATWGVDKISWWANNGSGSFGSENVVTSSYQNARNVQAADIDGDADMDMISVADNDDSVDWYENDGSESFTKTNITTTFTAAYYSVAQDMDGDGDVDIIATAQDDNELSWWENDLADERNITGNDPDTVRFSNDKVIIDFASGFSDGNTSVFYNQGKVTNKSLVGTGVDHVATNGYYTITTAATTYNAEIKFSYSGITEWSAINDENDLRICYFDPTSGTDGQWVVAGTGQTRDTVNDTITVSGLSSELAKYSVFTMGSSTTDNSLPVELVSFEGAVTEFGIELSWQTASELNNFGFELWRKSSSESSFSLVSSYNENEDLEGLGTSSFGKDYTFVDYEVEKGRHYTYHLIDITYDGKRYTHPDIKIDFVSNGLVRVVNVLLPDKLQLQQNYPNPFNPNTRIHFSIPKKENGQTVKLVVFNQLGQKVKTLFNSSLADGNYSIVWNGKNDQNQAVASGMYIYLLQAGRSSIIKRMTLVR